MERVVDTTIVLREITRPEGQERMRVQTAKMERLSKAAIAAATQRVQDANEAMIEEPSAQEERRERWGPRTYRENLDSIEALFT